MARSKLYPGQRELALEGISGSGADGAGGRAGTAVITSKSNAASWQVSRTGYDRLGFDAVDDKAFRSAGPGPDRGTNRQGRFAARAQRPGVPHSSLRTMFGSCCLRRCL